MKYLRIKQVQEIVPVSKSTIYQWIKEGRFPAPTKLGERTSAWEENILTILRGVDHMAFIIC
ncbi:MAG: AlpA family phage regulatory protein [Proteobacteria bacterium]|nr:AlpA family phage regulatory protein [Pseudomonadota bacterium]